MSRMRLDLELLENKDLFKKIKEQSDLIASLFSDLANEFPQKELKKFHQNSKGTKISKGYNLENKPYQVLDLVRDFDDQTGFNIRILNWWGNGLFIFIYYGCQTLLNKNWKGPKAAPGFIDCSQFSPWAYGEIISAIINPPSIETGSKPLNESFSQYFKPIRPVAEYSKTFDILQKEIKLIIDNHY